MAVELKPCPCCGGEAEFKERRKPYIRFTIRCKVCKLGLPWLVGHTAIHEKWNRRTYAD